ncbi:ATP synthase subunit g, mitochondrial-like [Oppia nitens]|uniref:ATP synthase subunit g, mitochondrial-like n=1 Tax=Oppia nitens TaxID=1686743 RepID=UPI0023DB5136|nr:ATP synthase subunit g, mitochondrial-like [Oppia nitens]
MAAKASLVSKVSKQIPILIDKSKPKLATFVRYAKVELIPPNPTEIPQIVAGFKNLVTGVRSGRWRQLSVSQAWLNTLITVEVVCWFFVGEVIGKRHLIGYDV